MGNEELWVQSVLEMPKRRDILAIVLIVLPWTLLITVWHQSTIAPLLAVHKDEGGDSRRDLAQGSDSKEYCLSDRDIVEVVRTEYVYTRPPPWSDTLPTIHIITPTYSRPVQKAELTRLANTLLHVPNLHWILVEDSQRRTPLVTRLLRDTGLNYTHLNVETPRNYKLRGDMRDPRIPRGTMQRNLALRWLRETFNKNSSQPGIVYFADDDNTYSLELFEEMRTTRKVSVWPVAFVGGLRYESPKVNAAGKVYGWKTVFDPHRPFAIDMAGFAVNLRLILQRSQAYFKLRGVKGGYQESSLLRELVTLNDLEPKAANCTKKILSSCRLLSTAASQTHKQLPGRLLTSKCFKCKKNKQVRTTNHTCTAQTLPIFLLDSEQNRALWRQRNSTDLTFSTRCKACRMLELEGACAGHNALGKRPTWSWFHRVS
ncbi:galactosylgalactosylxylosylprotein 3-beta-glucuronosyltransferase 1 isoform X5 [Caretta caretta]|nr:galactosylgalactosylxylosylprotein 3-beta-glucuronosyltransferase 1 isoform X2 [Caretta caretta]XP_048683193.1 galactosylgalactosylxylosylprotein 3-beta-glucuronosyltransferase 1 isoform X2 [Caretta caretta]